MQIINKKCPYCSAIFKVKSALESHLQTKHADKQMINIDTIPEIHMNSPSAQHQSLDLSILNIQHQNSDFWKSKLMQQQPMSSSMSFQPQRRGEFSESEISFTDSNNEELPDDDYDLDNFNDDSNHGDENAVSANDKEKNKRHRTHVNRTQKSILRKIFDDVKSSSMVDCENIGKEIGLFKRVVQVRIIYS